MTTRPNPSPHPYAEFLHRLEKPARYTGGEVGSVRKDWDAALARVCLAFPDVYDIGMSHLGFKILYDVLNRDERTLAERAYTPWVDLEAELRARELPLVSLDSHRPLSSFDVVGFSLQYELTYTNVLTMLDLGGIPLRSADRSEDDPLIVAGGPNATHPEPLAQFLDAIVVGDGEAKLTELALAWTEMRRLGKTRGERLEALARLGSIYVPSLYETAIDPSSRLEVVQAPTDRALPFPIDRARVKLDDFPFPHAGPTGGPEAIFDRTSIEITRGCTEGCRFCQAGMIYRPIQERDPAQVIDTVRKALEATGNDEVSLTALSTADVSYIHPLIKTLAPELAAKGVSLSVSSLRAYGLDPSLLDELKRVRAAGLTFAPEAGTQRMRDVVNKNVTEAQLMETAERVFSRGWARMKLYFMIGLPTEEDEDVLGIVGTGARTASVGRKAAGRKVDVTVSVSTHVPKPHTPFQWAAMDSLDEIRRKHRLLKDAVRPHKQVKLRVHDSRSSVLEGIMARGDRRLGDVIERAWRGGARFDSWDEQLNLEVWEEALAHFSIDKSVYLSTLPVTGRLPWDHLDVGLEDGFLLREYRKAIGSRLSPPCGKVAGAFVHHTNLQDAEADRRRLVCYDCGVACDMTTMRSDRLVRLGTLGAREPAEASEPPVAKLRRPRVGDPNAGHRYRLRFEKKGAVALLGHLDLVRELPRIFRRLGVGQIYTGGFHPKPDMTFAPALGLGAMSLDEYVDVRLEANFDAAGLDDLLTRMNASSPDGLVFTEAMRLGPGHESVAKLVTGARFAIAFAKSALERSEGEMVHRWLSERCEAVLAEPTLWVTRRSKGIGRRIDVRPHLRELRVLSEPREMLLCAGLHGDLVAIEAVVALGGQGSIKPSEIAAAVIGEEDPPHRVVRLALFGEAGARSVSPLDLAPRLWDAHAAPA
jgi:radical SAM family uncharacterized protein/radical SAM-linked protein